MKILKFIFVDDVNPNEILATTFTRKTANELNSRILSWGDEIKKHLYKSMTDEKKIKHLNKIDFNQIITGTTDSIAITLPIDLYSILDKYYSMKSLNSYLEELSVDRNLSKKSKKEYQIAVNSYCEFNQKNLD